LSDEGVQPQGFLGSVGCTDIFTLSGRDGNNLLMFSTSGQRRLRRGKMEVCFHGGGDWFQVLETVTMDDRVNVTLGEVN